MRGWLSLAVALISSVAAANEPWTDRSTAMVPVGADGKRLNLDFETGTLKDWTASGAAFEKQPIKGDTVHPRRSDMKSEHQGQYWIGTFEIAGDKPMGTLVSVPFAVTHPHASFLVGGGPWDETRVEIVRADGGQIIFKASGFEAENLHPVAVDLREHLGKQIFIRLIDEHTGHWGHINFDDFRFHESAPSFPEKKRPVVPPPLDVVKNEGLTGEQAAKEMTLPEGFSATVFAAEPDVHQPVAFCIDHRGRLWVAEAYGYPKRQPEGEGKDKIVIFEDTDGDGRHDKRTTFIEGLNLVSGLELGFGGVFVGAAPHLLFIADRDGDDRPDSAPEVLLDGWGYQDTHETLNAFIWGPDGWLYGCHGVFTHSKVGKPGTPEGERTPINAGIWRYHPTKRLFEVFAEGTSNPWGVDFNDHGQAFATACVIPHLYHIIQGARYQRQAGKHFNPHIYRDIATIADHVHYAGTGGPHAGNNRSDAAGGGHAHCGAMIYLGDLFPASYRNTIIMGNIHGNRFNTDILERKGSGYVGRHGKDFLLMNDKWSRLINIKYGPDGSVYFIDWYDQQACHRPEPEIWDRTNGRIYRVTYKGTRHAPVDLSKLADSELVRLQLHANDWYVRIARRILQERDGGEAVQAALVSLLRETKDVPKRLRVLWALHATGGATDALLLSEMKHADEYARAWAIQLAAEDRQVTAEQLAVFEQMAKEDPSPVVRLYLASTLQRLPLEQRWGVLEGLVAHPEDADDHNLPLMVWYALEPLVPNNPGKALALASASKLPNLREFAARRVASAGR